MLYKNDTVFSKIQRYFVEMFYGMSTRIVDFFVPVKKKHWIFGADYGYSYRENSKYLFEYMVENHPDYMCIFVTNNKDVQDEIRGKGYPCVINDSLSGVLAISKADAVFTSQNPNDIKYAFKKKGRTYYYLTHGQPYKNCRQTLPKSLVKEDKSLMAKVRLKFAQLFCVDYSMRDVSFVPAASEFLKPYVAMTIGQDIPAKILGMPKNDRMSDAEKMNKERWVDGLDGKFVITYMPTHRQYGKGAVTPTPFENNTEAQEWMRQNNVVFLMKQHPNMIPKLTNPIDTDVIKDITKMKLDPAVVMYHTDVLITDFSSAFIEFLWFKRPLLFYIYDNYADVEGALYDITGDFPDAFCYDEKQLYEHIKSCFSNFEQSKPSEKIVSKYYQSSTHDACEKYFEAVVEDKKYC